MNRLDDFRSALRRLDSTVVALDSRNARQVLTVVGCLAAGQDVPDSQLRSLQRPPRKTAGPVSAKPTFIASARGAGKSIAFVSMRGIATFDCECQPWAFSTMVMARTVTQLSLDASVDAIVLDIDTPGGAVTGTMEAADAVWAARKKKPVVGLVNPLCASAGYWIGSQCTSIIGIPSADVGSVGVFMCHYDMSEALANFGIKPTFIYAGEHKVEGNSMEPLEPDAKAWFQSEVDSTYSDFLSAVARGRGMGKQAVFEKFGKGRLFSAPMAKRVGMIDEIETSDIALSKIIAGHLPTRSAAGPGAEYRARLAELAAESMSPAEKHRRAEADKFRRRLAILGA